MMEQMGREPDPDKTPLDYEDLCVDAQLALYLYNKLGNRVYGDVGFTGKDYTILPILIKHHEILDVDLLIDYLNVIDTFNINTSQEALKKELDKVKSR